MYFGANGLKEKQKENASSDCTTYDSAQISAFLLLRLRKFNWCYIFFSEYIADRQRRENAKENKIVTKNLAKH